MNEAECPSSVSLNNAALSCEIALRGAELRSLRDIDTNDEFIWQRDPHVWAASAPILFPVIGRFKDGGYLLDGRFHEIPKHGFAREMDFSLLALSPAAATLRLTNSEATQAAYPYAFELQVTFTLQGRMLAVEYRLENLNGRDMPFALGSHPAFDLPVNLGPLEDWSIYFDAIEQPVCHRVSDNLLSSKPEPFKFDTNNSIKLTEGTFLRDALIFKDIRSRCLQIVHRVHGLRVRFDTGGASTLGIWAKRGAPYVCLEPWWGFDDSSEINADILKKPALLRLAVGESFSTGYSIAV